MNFNIWTSKPSRLTLRDALVIAIVSVAFVYVLLVGLLSVHA